MSLSNDELLSNIKRQAKRLSKNTNVPLRQAQSHLAMCVYQCDDWVDYPISVVGATGRSIVHIW